MTAAEAGLMLLPQAAAIVAGGVLAPVLLRWLQSGTATMLALLLQATGLGMLAVTPTAVLAPLAFIGLGFGVAGTLAATTLFDVTTVDHAGQVGAIQEVGFALGGGLGIAVLGTIAAVVASGGVIVAIATGAVIVLLAAVAPHLGRGRARTSRSNA